MHKNDIEEFDIVRCEGENWLVLEVVDDGELYMLQHPELGTRYEYSDNVYKSDVSIAQFDALVIVLKQIKSGRISVDGFTLDEYRANNRKVDPNKEALSKPKKTAEKSLSEYRKESNTSSKKKQSIAASVSIDSNIAELLLNDVIYEGNLNRLLDKLDKELYDGECTAETLADLEDLHFEREHRKG